MKNPVFSLTEPLFRVLPGIRGGEKVFFVQRKRKIFKFTFWSFYVDSHSLDKVICDTFEDAVDCIKHLIKTYYFYREIDENSVQG